jgi:hypothetical protein
MGTELTLDIGGLSIDYAKNTRGHDHGFLFRNADRQRRRSKQINYDSIEEDDPDLAMMETGFARRLRSVVPRLELLGYTQAFTEAAYLRAVADATEHREILSEAGLGSQTTDFLSFDEFRAFVASVSIEALDDTFIVGGGDRAKRITGRFTDETFKARIPYHADHDSASWSEKSYFGALVNILHPYAMLRLFAANESNLDAMLEWDFGMLVANGWAEEREFVGDARRQQTFLIATEGSSDVHVLERALALRRPDITDFFHFIDVSERHPFSGVGNLVRFAEGLVKIDVQNQIIFVLDNDAEGLSAHRRIEALAMPHNMRAITLPELPAFSAFPTRGPDGVKVADINGCAAAIECYLDLNCSGAPKPEVRWTSYNKDLDRYQGELVHKEGHAKLFFERSVRTGYDFTKLDAVLDAICAVCTSMAERRVGEADVLEAP